MKNRFKEWFDRNHSYGSFVVIYAFNYEVEMKELRDILGHNEKLRKILCEGFPAQVKLEKMYIDMTSILEVFKLEK